MNKKLLNDKDVERFAIIIEKKYHTFTQADQDKLTKFYYKLINTVSAMKNIEVWVN